MMGLTVEPRHSGIVVKTNNNVYAFPFLAGDQIRGGEKSDIEDTVTYGGDSTAKHYIRTHDMSEVPEEVLEAVRDRGYTILDNVDGGWASWDGRPEFSTSYVDITDAEPV